MIYLELFWTFFKIGAFTVGGGYAMLPLFREQMLLHNWATTEEIMNFIAVSESTPGPFAVNMATYIGSEMGGFFGSVCATLGIVLPSFIIILIVAKCFEKFKENKLVKGAMSGLKPAVIGFIASALLSLAITVFIPNGFSLEIFATSSLYVSLFICVLASILAFKKVHPILIVVISAALGIAEGYLFH